MEPTSPKADILSQYDEYERQITIRHLKVGCLLVMVLMPAGGLLDWYVYPAHLGAFLMLRLETTLLAGLVLLILNTPLSRRMHQTLGMFVALLPVFFICLMIYQVGEPASPYYAGLNLVLLAIAFVLRWNVTLSVIAVLSTLVMYGGTCLLIGRVTEAEERLVFNNLYFLVLTGIIVITGGRIHRILRIREFHLRYELAESKEMLEHTNQKLRELDRVKSRFFANISHELRTPLTLLLAPLEILQHSPEKRLDTETRESLAVMHANAMRLLKLINDLLDLVRLESGRMEVRREAFHLPDFLKGLASAAGQLLNERQLQLDVHVAPGLHTVVADRDKLERILLNLLFNALKFTPAGGRVSLSGQRQGESLVMTVSDTGVGIARDHLPFVFDRFWQADNSARREHQGAGIGLALVKELTEIQGGSVTVESDEGKGTAFQVRLPFLETTDPTPAETRPVGDTSDEWLAGLYRRAELFPPSGQSGDPDKPAGSPANPDRPSVLIADDEPDMLNFLKSQLHHQFRVIEARNGREAVEQATRHLPDIILLDMMMPDKDGLQACQELRAQESTRRIPIIVLTARADEQTKLTVLSNGASDFLAKPFSTTELHVRVQNLVEAHDLQRRLSRQNQVLESTIEQLKETEIQLVQAEKIASLGRMSAGIIHEINNPLNFAATGLYALKKHLPELPPDRQAEYAEIFQDIEEGLNRVKTIVSDLRAFTHPDTRTREQVRIEAVVNDALKFLSNEWKSRIRIETHLPAGLALDANKNRLLQLLLNLLQNAFDALRRKNFADETPTVWIEGRSEADRLLLVIRDNGDGIAPEHLGKIFEPFFTTKDVGQGMGLGLSICYRIIQELGGQVRVRSEHGKFSEFTLEFPHTGPD